MKTTLLLALFCVAAAQPVGPALDSVYRYYVTGDLAAAEEIILRLDASAKSPADRFAVKLELADYLLDKKQAYPDAESVCNVLLTQFPKEQRRPDVMYRQALAQELSEKFLDAAKNYEQVATRYMKTTYGTDALDAIERCFRKNYQDRVAYVNGFPITRIEIDERISRYPAAYEAFDKKLQLLDTMIDNRLLFEAARAAGTDKTPAFTEEFQQMRNRYVFEEWYGREVTAKAEPGDKVLKAQYKKDLAARYTTPEKVHGFEIVVADRALADSLRRALLADTGLAWDTVAKQHSTAADKNRGGDMGFFARGVHPKPVENAAFGQKIAAISQPIKTETGWMLLKVTEKTPKSVRTYDEVKSQIQAQLRQENSDKYYDQTVEALKRKASVNIDTTALEAEKDTLGVVDGVAITRAQLDARLEQIPPFFRGQFETPEGRRRILDQMVLENLILKDCEAKKTWLWNKVVDRVLEQKNRMMVDRYLAQSSTEQVQVDTMQLKAEYKKNLKDYRQPAQVHLREITAPTRVRAALLRAWAKAGKLPALVSGRALLVPPADAEEVRASLTSVQNADSLAAEYGLVEAPFFFGGPTIPVANRNVPNLGARCRAVGPMRDSTRFAFGFVDLSAQDTLFAPVLTGVADADAYNTLTGQEPQTDSLGTALIDQKRLGTYASLKSPLSSSMYRATLKLGTGEVGRFDIASGALLVKMTKKDTAQTAAFADIARRFSASPTRWSGGDLNWLNKDEEGVYAKQTSTGFGLSEGAVSEVFKLNDSTYAFIKVEEKKATRTQPFDEVKAKLEDKARRDETKRLQDQLRQGLRSGAKVEVLMKEADFVFETEPIEEPGTPPAPEPEK
jgi:peptidyl-prolyl cis-trans isomerase C